MFTKSYMEFSLNNVEEEKLHYREEAPYVFGNMILTNGHELLTELNKVREAIIGGNFDELSINDHIVFPFPQPYLTLKFCPYVKHCLIPTFIKGKNLYYTQSAKPLKFLSHAMYINITIQLFCSQNGKPLSVNNPFPLTSTLIPQHIRLDTHLLNERFSKFKGRADDIRSSVFTEILTDKVVESYKRETKGCFQLKISSIVTEGIACSVVLIRKDLVDENENVFKIFTSKTYPERYLHSLSAKNVEKLKLKDKRIVAIDPNEYDLIHCVSPNPAVTITPEQSHKMCSIKKENFQKSKAKNAKVLKEERSNYKIYQAILTLTLIMHG
ncbi:hypothetical protein P9112_008945 [Eukaryota sp. TZLM1-RC]